MQKSPRVKTRGLFYFQPTRPQVFRCMIDFAKVRKNGTEATQLPKTARNTFKEQKQVDF